MRAIMGTLDEEPEMIEQRVELRLARQALLTRPGAPRLWAVIDETALRRPVGGAKVMRAQLQRLVDATKLPNVTLQVLPFGAGAHPAMVGAFSILRFADVDLPDIVYLEHLAGAMYLDKREDVHQYLHVMETTCVQAETPDRTAAILKTGLSHFRLQRQPKLPAPPGFPVGSAQGSDPGDIAQRAGPGGA